MLIRSLLKHRFDGTNGSDLVEEEFSPRGKYRLLTSYRIATVVQTDVMKEPHVEGYQSIIAPPDPNEVHSKPVPNWLVEGAMPAKLCAWEEGRSNKKRKAAAPIGEDAKPKRPRGRPRKNAGATSPSAPGPAAAEAQRPPLAPQAPGRASKQPTGRAGASGPLSEQSKLKRPQSLLQESVSATSPSAPGPSVFTDAPARAVGAPEEHPPPPVLAPKPPIGCAGGPPVIDLTFSSQSAESDWSL